MLAGKREEEVFLFYFVCGEWGSGGQGRRCGERLTGLEEQDDCKHGQSRLAMADNSQDVEDDNGHS